MAKSSKSIQKIELSVEQLNAIELLVTGATDQAVADQIGLSRQTITDWRNNNNEFAATLERKRQALWATHEDDLRSLISKAIEILRQGMESKDQRIAIGAAVHVLRAVGLYSASLKPGGDTSAYMVGLSKSLLEAF